MQNFIYVIHVWMTIRIIQNSESLNFPLFCYVVIGIRSIFSLFFLPVVYIKKHLVRLSSDCCRDTQFFVWSSLQLQIGIAMSLIVYDLPPVKSFLIFNSSLAFIFAEWDLQNN